MKRREFITLLGGAAAAWPLAARAQQPAMPVIGFLDSRSPDAIRGPPARISPGPQGHGLCRGRERGDRIPLGRESDRSAAGAGGRTGSPTGRRDRRARRYRCGVGGQGGNHDDPHRLHRRPKTRSSLVLSPASPGRAATLTGINFFTAELAAKRLELLRELVPAATRVAVLVNPANATIAESTLRDVEPAARAMGLQIQVLNASTSREIDAAFATLVRERADALFVGPRRLLQQPARPTGATWRRATRFPRYIRSVNIAEVGGLMS